MYTLVVPFKWGCILWPWHLTLAIRPFEDLLRQCNQESMATIVIRRRWKWIGHLIRRDQNSITRTALYWTPEGKCKSGRPTNTWRRTLKGELKSMNNSWGTIEKMAKTDRNGGPLLLPYIPMAFRAVNRYDPAVPCSVVCAYKGKHIWNITFMS